MQVGPTAVGDQSQSDDTHGLLGVVGAVGEGDQRCGADLAPAEPGVTAVFRDSGHNRENDPGADPGHQAGDDRRGHGRDDD